MMLWVMCDVDAKTNRVDGWRTVTFGWKMEKEGPVEIVRILRICQRW